MMQMFLIDVPDSTYSVLDEKDDTSITAKITVSDAHKKDLTEDTSAGISKLACQCGRNDGRTCYYQ